MEIIAGIASIVGVGGTLTLAIWALTAERRAGSQNARATELAVRLELAQATVKNESARADREKERADALDALIDEIAANDDPSVARAHVLSRRTRKAGTADGDPGAVSGGGSNPEVARGPDDDLLNPFE